MSAAEKAAPALVPKEHLPDFERNKRMTGGRSIKLLRPPFVAFRQVSEEVPIYEDILKEEEYEAEEDVEVQAEEDVLGEDGEPTGEKRTVARVEKQIVTKTRMVPTGKQRLKTVETRVHWAPGLQWKECVISPGVNGGQSLQRALAKGCKFPQDLETPDYPSGVAPCCEFRGCFQQARPDGQPLIRTRYGQFCSDMEAKMAKYHWDGKTPSGKRMEVGFNSRSREKREQQIASIPVELVG